MQDAAERQARHRPAKDVQEAPNAINAYDRYRSLSEVELGQRSRPPACPPESDQVSDQAARLLAALRKGPKTAARLMADMGLSHRPTFRKNYLRPAMSAGLVEMTHPESPTHRNQKYRLTARGRLVR